jgi:glutathione S-transferase
MSGGGRCAVLRMSGGADAAPALRLWTSGSWPYAQRAAIGLEERGLAYERVAVDLQNKPANFTSVYTKAVATEPHPTLARAKVPILEHLDGTPPLTESLVITEYLEDRWPKIQP